MRSSEVRTRLGLTPPDDDDVLEQKGRALPSQQAAGGGRGGEQDGDDAELQELVDRERWQPLLQPMYDELAMLAQQAQSYEEFRPAAAGTPAADRSRPRSAAPIRGAAWNTSRDVRNSGRGPGAVRGVAKRR